MARLEACLVAEGNPESAAHVPISDARVTGRSEKERHLIPCPPPGRRVSAPFALLHYLCHLSMATSPWHNDPDDEPLT